MTEIKGDINMNNTISKIGAAIVTVTVFLFAVFIISGFSAGQYFVCSVLPIGYIMMSAGFQHECGQDRKVAANIGMVLAAVYAVLVLLVYFSQNTTVRLVTLNEQAGRLLIFQPGSLTFNYDLLGYGIMALSTFFIGLSIKAENTTDKCLKWLMIIHGAFYPGCFIMPMTGMFLSMADGEHGKGGDIALLFWCIYFIPIGMLAFLHFGKDKE